MAKAEDRRRGDGSAQPATGVLSATAREAFAIEADESARQTAQDRLALTITRLTGSIGFVLLNVVWFSVWIVVNLPGSPLQFDPFPFSFLTIMVSLEAICLSSFVLISENSQARRAERLARLEMQVNILAEREITRLIRLVSEIHEHLGLGGLDAEEQREMGEETRLADVAQAVDSLERPDARTK